MSGSGRVGTSLEGDKVLRSLLTSGFVGALVLAAVRPMPLAAQTGSCVPYQGALECSVTSPGGGLRTLSVQFLPQLPYMNFYWLNLSIMDCGNNSGPVLRSSMQLWGREGVPQLGPYTITVTNAACVRVEARQCTVPPQPGWGEPTSCTDRLGTGSTVVVR